MGWHTLVRNTSPPSRWSCYEMRAEYRLMLNLGDDNDLVVTISKFTPNVECTGQVSSRFSIAEACQGSLDKMTTMKGDLKLSSNPPPPLQPRIKQLPFYMDYFTRRGKSFQNALITTFLISFGDKMILQMFPVQWWFPQVPAWGLLRITHHPTACGRLRWRLTRCASRMVEMVFGGVLVFDRYCCNTYGRYKNTDV